MAGYEIGDKIVKHTPQIEIVTVQVPTDKHDSLSTSDILWPFLITILIILVIVITREVINKCFKRYHGQYNQAVTYHPQQQEAQQIHIQPQAACVNIPRGL